MDRRKTILVIDDDPAITRLLCCALTEEYHVQVASSGEEGLRWAEAVCPQLVLLDLNLPRLGGLAVLRRLRATSRRVPIVIMTAYGKIESAVQSMRLGAIDYLQKPIGMDKLKRQMQEWCAMQEANHAESPACRKVVGESPQIRRVWQLIKKFAPSDMTILLEGESGTGKELFARAIHECSKRRHGPLVPLDCASLPNSIIESEIFGYERGAFTDSARLHLDVGVELADKMDLKVFRASVADAAEKELITCVTQGDRFKQFELAAFLNIDPKTLRSKLKRYGLSQEEQVHGGKDPGSRRSG